MISVSQAKILVEQHTNILEGIWHDLYETTGLIIAEDVYSPSDSPPFNQSAMDGYAFRFEDLNSYSSLKVVGEIAAGDFSDIQLTSGTALRIYTGAQVPSFYDTVVMQEKIELEGDQLFVRDAEKKKGMNVRLKGSQIKLGDIVLKKGHLINAGAAGFIANTGVSQIKVIPKVKVSIISTGNELNFPGNQLEPGKVFECNTYILNSALKVFDISPINIFRVKDELVAIKEAVAQCLVQSDLIILSGGVSVGNYDFVAAALEQSKVECIFHKVKQKPGKPLYFGKKDKTLIFGLPGNPAALLTCFYEYISPTIRKMMGLSSFKNHQLNLKLTAPYNKKAGLTHFLKGKINGDEVEILNAQESYLLSSFAIADCIVQLEEEKTNFEKGERLEVHLINPKN